MLLPSALLPLASVPMKLPYTTVSVEPSSQIALFVVPEITLPWMREP
jgi:hypothetical protein